MPVELVVAVDVFVVVESAFVSVAAGAFVSVVVVVVVDDVVFVSAVAGAAFVSPAVELVSSAARLQPVRTRGRAITLRQKGRTRSSFMVLIGLVKGDATRLRELSGANMPSCGLRASLLFSGGAMGEGSSDGSGKPEIAQG
jgi:hypothetical protein